MFCFTITYHFFVPRFYRTNVGVAASSPAIEIAAAAASFMRSALYSPSACLLCLYWLLLV